MARLADPFATAFATHPASPARPTVPAAPITRDGLPDLDVLFAPVDGYAAYAGVGSTDTPLDICIDMRRIAGEFERRGFMLRSGHAPGADRAFEDGVAAKRNAEIFLPWRRFEGSSSTLYPRDLELELRAEAIAERYHPAWDRCKRGARALLTRDVKQVLGASLDRPSRFVLCWTEDGRASGGTGQAIRVARGHSIPVLNMHGAAMRARVLAALGL